MQPFEDLKHKVILITGSTLGIGKAIANLCLSLGAKVMIHGRSQENVKAAIESFSASSEQIGTCLVDFLAEKDAAEKLIEATVERFGRIDGLVNNAGIYPRCDIDSLNSELFDQVIQVNLKAPMFLIQEATKAFRKQASGGTVLNIGSINAYGGQRDLLVYSASKGGLMAMTHNLGHTLAKEKIRVNQLNVGWTLTETEKATREKEGFSKDWEKQITKTLIPSGKLLRPENIAKHAIFWISDLSAPASGTVCDVEQYPITGRNLIPELTENMSQ
jgi:NAD(P)-dependent dehydrogenase (short-subunit alcohol dehydrogenase family)